MDVASVVLRTNRDHILDVGPLPLVANLPLLYRRAHRPIYVVVLTKLKL